MMAHIFHEIPSLDTLPKSPTKEDRLVHILKNLEKQRKSVHKSILKTASQQIATLPPTPSQPPDEADKEEAQAHLLASLQFIRAPFPDPAHPPPPPTDSIKQLDPPPQLQVTLDAVRQIEQYDRQFRRSRKRYQMALERLRGGDAVVGGERRFSSESPLRRRSSVGSSMGGLVEVGQQQQQRQAVPQRVGSGMVDGSRDPRRRG
ncbi:hypothetical protein Q7P37_010920 [Cladosporium fusiforme]